MGQDAVMSGDMNSRTEGTVFDASLARGTILLNYFSGIVCGIWHWRGSECTRSHF